MSFGLACRAFVAVLRNPDVAGRVRQALSQTQPADSMAGLAEKSSAEQRIAPQTNTQAQRIEPVKVSAPVRSEALTLLSTLQREARFLDLVYEPVEEYEDAQVGAAAREVMRDCRKSLERLFAIKPLCDQPEGSAMSVPANPSAVRWRLIGKSPIGQASATVTHRGWKAEQCQIPTWTAADEDCLILAPVELDVS